MVVVACILALFVLLTGYSQAIGGITMVSIVKDYVNMRTGPGTRYKTLWVLGKGCPLKVVGSKGNWYRVKDFGGGHRLDIQTPYLPYSPCCCKKRNRQYPVSARDS